LSKDLEIKMIRCKIWYNKLFRIAYFKSSRVKLINTSFIDSISSIESVYINGIYNTIELTIVIYKYEYLKIIENYNTKLAQIKFEIYVLKKVKLYTNIIYFSTPVIKTKFKIKSIS